MSVNRVANLRKLRRVFASNISQEVPSTSNATKQTLSETIEGNKRSAKRRMVLIDEVDDKDDDIFEGAPIKVRSHTQKAEIWKMVSNERILVMFNKFGKPVGDEGKELVQYLGTLVRMLEHVSIEYSDWRKVPMQQKEDMYSLVKAMKNDGVYPTRGEMYIKTRTRKDGSVVDDEAASVVPSLKAIASVSKITPGDRDDFTRDDYSKVKGPEKRGYVRLVGRMPATKDKVDLASNSQTIHQLQSVVNVMMNIIHEHIPNANLSTVLSDMNIQVPRIGSSTLNNCLSGNKLSSSRSHDDEDIVDKV
ncbi:hypothetical protein R6Q59_007042 [Mikania micrantha]